MFAESNRIEFKAELNDKLEKEIVAFLNNREGGILYVGVNNEGHPIGLEDLDGTQLKIADRIKDNILPSPLGLFDIVTEYIDNVPVIKVLVSGGLEKPYYIKSKGMSPSGCYTRVGSSTQPMTIGMIENLYARRIHTTLRNIPSPRQDLSFAQLRIYYEESELKLNEKFADTLELKTPDGKYNYLAYLLADENGTSIKIAKYSGTTKVDLIENEEYGYCSLIKATLRVLDKFEIENKTRTKITPTVRIQRNLVNKVALREAVINAIVHNDFSREIPPVFEIFSDKIVISSYGGLIHGQTMEDFFSCCSVPRNRELMRIFRDLGLVEQLGSGMSRILEAYGKDIFHISDNFIKVIFPLDENGELIPGKGWRIPDKQENILENKITDKSPTINVVKNHQVRENVGDNVGDNVRKNVRDNDVHKKLITILKKDPTLTQEQLGLKMKMTSRNVGRIIKHLRETGKIERIGSDRKGYWRIID